MNNPEIDQQTLKHICEMTVQLTALRQKGCEHLCIENIAPDIFHRLLSRYWLFINGQMAVDPMLDIVK